VLYYTLFRYEVGVYSSCVMTTTVPPFSPIANSSMMSSITIITTDHIFLFQLVVVRLLLIYYHSAV